MTSTQSAVMLTTDTTAETAPGAILLFQLPEGFTTADLDHDQTVSLTVYARDFTDLATDWTDATAAGVVWPADAPYPLPAGEYNVLFKTPYPSELPDNAMQAPFVADVVLVAQEVAADADLATLTAAYNGAVAAHDELATQFNQLLHSLRASGQMAPE